MKRNGTVESASGLALAGLAIGYFFVLVTTPNPLDWHLTTAGRRLLLHLWPAALLLFFVWLSTVEEAIARGRPDPSPATRSPCRSRRP